MIRTRAAFTLAAGCALSLFSAGSSAASLNPLSHETPPSTVGSVSAHHDATKIWGLDKLLVATPKLIRVRPSPALPADPAAAIAQYEQVAETASDPRLQAEALQRAAELRLQRADAGEGLADDVPKVIALYQRLLSGHPQHPGNDLALYQLGRAYQLAGKEPLATAALKRLGADYPDSPRAAEAHFRAAEMLYQAHDYRGAETQYSAVVAAGSDGHFYEPAQYKLAWALYQQHRYGPALPVLLAMLDRDLPNGTLEDPDTALAAVPADRSERTTEALRLTGLCFIALGGGVAVGEQLQQTPEAGRIEVLLYTALADQLLDRRRYTDAAEAYAAFIDRHPLHARAPDFQSRIIAVYREAGFTERVIAAQTTYAQRYAPDAEYWNGRTVEPSVVAELRKHLDVLARYARAAAQQAEGETARAGNLRAAHWYQRILELYPDDPQRKPTRMLYADALLDAGKIAAAAEQYRQLAFADDSAEFPGAAEAAHAAVLAYGRLADSAPPGRHDAALQARIDASLELAKDYPDHPQRTAALTTAATDLLTLGQHPRAIEVAQMALDAHPSDGQRRVAWSVMADARFAESDYADAETAYAALLGALAPDTPAPQRDPVVERLAASIYKQGEAARAGGDPAAAADIFLRVGQRVPDASIRATADFDASAALIAAGDWPRAAATLESFRLRFPGHALTAEVDRKLAVTYDHTGNAAAAAATYARIARRATEAVEDRRIAAWRAARRYDQAKRTELSAMAYEYYVQTWPQPLDTAVDARKRLAEIAAASGSPDELRWLKSIVAAERSAGDRDTEHVRLLAADAQLRLGRVAADQATAIALRLPLQQSLPRRVAATKAAVAALAAAADYGFAETTTAATYELASLYRDLSRDLLASPRPPGLGELEREQYQILLEEQAYPFETRAIEINETNLARVDQGIWNDWIRRSVAELVALDPARYGKHEHREVRYDSPT